MVLFAQPLQYSYYIKLQTPTENKTKDRQLSYMHTQGGCDIFGACAGVPSTQTF